MRSALTFLATILAGASVTACSGRHAQPPSLLSLSCVDSAGQQGADHQTLVGGVTGLVLPDSADPAGLYPIRGKDGKGYFVYKAMLAVSASAEPFVTISVTAPAGAKLVYGPAAAAAPPGQSLLAAARTQVRLPVCGPDFTSYAGGVIIPKPACVTFRVSSPPAKPATVSVPIGPSTCPPR